MRIPRIRFSVQRLMIAVAGIALALGLGLEVIRLKRYRDQCMAKANQHGQAELTYLAMEKRTRQTAAEVESFGTESLKMSGETIRAPRNASLKKSHDKIQRLLKEANEAQAARGQDEAPKYAEYAAYHASLKGKYLRASDFHWPTVEPDPPPPEPEARGFYWSERGEFARAMAAYEEALKLLPDDYYSLNGLAWILSTCPKATIRDGKRAVQLATRACDLTFWEMSAYVDTLAAAQAEAGDFKAAIELERKAIGLLSRGDPGEHEMQLRLEGYEANQPYRRQLR
jgi:tetratricopeptide (TPR) repeat protein